ncbi:MAG TPA: sporulation integral membrane protein YtvI [Candidatus Eisenbergiella merdipullorum]|uniref:Sporulation integral membrane protein YtvI n=1 Tax=Candidatus Eisenbergiella merdipullorum TaxID=2838553 RepID=A0A9D2L1E0_9FIRM|nr:sporulation integral membrane protein YtvI [Candidatus Eisenbergiella merdipullorum]
MNLEKQKTFLIRFAFWVIIIAIIYICLKYALPFFAPFAFGFVIAFLLNWPIRWLTKKLRVPRVLPAILLTALFFVAAGSLITFLGFRAFASIRQLIGALPSLYSTMLLPLLMDLFSQLEVALSALDPSAVAVLEDISRDVTGSLGSAVSSISMSAISAISSLAASVPGIFLNLVITIIVTFFMTIDYPKITEFILRQFPEGGRKVLFEIREYVCGTLIKCILSYALILFITFTEISIGLTVLRVPNAILIAVCIAIFDILPVLGTGGIMIPWAIISLITGDFFRGFGLLILYLIITVIRNIIEPKIVGHQVGLHPVVTLASMLAGLNLLGVIGLFGFPITLSLLKNLNDRGVIHIFK